MIRLIVRELPIGTRIEHEYARKLYEGLVKIITDWGGKPIKSSPSSEEAFSKSIGGIVEDFKVGEVGNFIAGELGKVGVNIDYVAANSNAPCYLRCSIRLSGGTHNSLVGNEIKDFLNGQPLKTLVHMSYDNHRTYDNPRHILPVY